MHRAGLCHCMCFADWPISWGYHVVSYSDVYKQITQRWCVLLWMMQELGSLICYYTTSPTHGIKPFLRSLYVHKFGLSKLAHCYRVNTLMQTINLLCVNVVSYYFKSPLLTESLWIQRQTMGGWWSWTLACNECHHVSTNENTIAEHRMVHSSLLARCFPTSI